MGLTQNKDHELLQTFIDISQIVFRVTAWEYLFLESS